MNPLSHSNAWKLCSCTHICGLIVKSIMVMQCYLDCVAFAVNYGSNIQNDQDRLIAKYVLGFMMLLTFVSFAIVFIIFKKISLV